MSLLDISVPVMLASREGSGESAQTRQGPSACLHEV